MPFDLTSAMLAGARAAPDLSPDVHLAIAQNSDSASSAIDSAETVAGYQQTAKALDTLQNQNDPQVVQAIHHHHQSFWGDLVHMGLGVAGLTSPKDAASAVLHAAGAPLRASQHLFRASEMLQATHGGQAGFGGGAVAPASVWAAFVSPTQWGRAWRQTTQGEKSFDPHVLNQVQARFDPDTFKVIADMASRTSYGVSGALHMTRPEDSLALIADPTARAAMAKRQQDPDILNAVRDLAAAKLSFGRAVVGHLARSHPGLASPISGGLDGAFDWFGDPTSKALGLVSEARKAALIAHSSDDVARIFAENQGVRNFASDVGDHLARAADAETPEARNQILGQLAERHPKLMPAMDELAKSGVRSGDDFRDWLMSKAGQKNLFTGKLPGFLTASGEGTILPSMGAIDMGRLAVKGWAKGSIDYLADHPTDGTDFTRSLWRMGARGGRIARRMTTIAPGVDFNPDSPEAVTQVQRFASLSMNANDVRQTVGAWTAAENLAERRQIFLGMLRQTFDGVGLNDQPATKAWAERFLQQYDEGLRNRVYSAAEHSMDLDGTKVNAGVLEQDMTENWALPSARRLWANAKRVGMMARMGGAVNADTVDRFMEKAWKPGQLMRFGFPVRSGGEEAIGMMLREGPMAWLKGRAAATALGPAPFADSRSLLAAYAGKMTHDAMAKVAKRLAPRQYLDAATELMNDPVTRDAFIENVSSLHHPSGVIVGDDNEIIRLTRDGGKVRRLRFEPTGDYKLMDRNDEFFHAHWKNQLDRLSRSEWARTALGARDADPVDRLNQVADAIEGSKQWTKSLRSRVTTDGRSVVGGEAEARQAALDHARVVIDHVDSLTRPNGAINVGGHDLADMVLSSRRAGEGPTAGLLKQIPDELKPNYVVGEQMLALPSNPLADMVEHGMKNVVGRPMDWIVRQPLFIHEYATARQALAKDMAPIFEDLGEGQARAVGHELALQRAVNRITPFIHDPDVRSQFAVMTRNLIPFWFAQEQFYKRWGAEFVHSPEALREAQLTMMGLRHAGFLHTDDKGNDFWMYPFVGLASHAINAGYTALTGKNVNFAINPGFMGQVRFASPGLERVGLPSFGPLAAIPIHALTDVFHLAGVQQSLLGRGAGRAYWESAAPTTLVNAVHTFLGAKDAPGQIATAMAQAAQYLEATGHGWDGTKETLSQYQDRLYQWSRNLVFLRMIYGYGGPSAPQAEFDVNDLQPEFRRLIGDPKKGGLGIERGTAEFIRRHPDATPYTVFQSKLESGGGSIPSTTKALNFLQGHQKFVGRYNYAGAWFTPQDPGDFNMAAYREEMMLGLRHRKGFQQFVKDMKAAEEGGPYWQNRDERDKRLKVAKAAGDTDAVKRINQAWTNWSQPYLAAHPELELSIQDPTAKVTRQQTMIQMAKALADPDAPDNQQTAHLRAVIGAYQTFVSRQAGLGGRHDSDATAQRKSDRTAMETWLVKYAADNADVEAFINHVVRPEVDPQGGRP